jgi:hypothetical protein
VKVRQFHPIVWAMCLILSFAAHSAWGSSLDLSFKVGYSFPVFVLMFIPVIFETWRLENREVDLKASVEKQNWKKR